MTLQRLLALNKCLLNQGFTLYFISRALGGIADVAAWGAVLSILLKLFPEKYATILSWTQMFFGLGYMLGNKLFKAFHT